MKDENDTKEQLMNEFLESDKNFPDLERAVHILKKSKGTHIETNDEFELQMLLDAFPFYVMVVDEDHKILKANKAIRSDLGLDPDQIIGEYCPKAVHGLDEPYPGCPLEETLKIGHGMEREFFDPDSNRWVNSAIYPIEQCTQEGREIFIHFIIDISERKRAEEDLELKAADLEEMNRALKGLLKRMDEDRNELEENVLFKVNKQLLPYLRELKTSTLDKKQRGFVSALESNLNNIISSFSRTLSLKYLNLTPIEIQIADLVKQGKSSKEIAGIFNLSIRTIEFHRQKIRKKLGIKKKNANLRTLLLSFK